MEEPGKPSVPQTPLQPVFQRQSHILEFHNPVLNPDPNMKKRLILSLNPGTISALLERYLIEATSQERKSFAERRRGKFRPTQPHGELRYNFLAKKYLE